MRYQHLHLIATLSMMISIGCQAPVHRSSKSMGSRADDGNVDKSSQKDNGAKSDVSDGPVQDVGSSACGNITSVGCCDGETLWYCDQGALQHVLCKNKPKCGWNFTGFFDCNTTGLSAPDPVKHPMDCKGLTGDSGVPKTDGPKTDAFNPCNLITREGCCAGNVLYYCEEGLLNVFNCSLNPPCGWYPSGKYYDCGNSELVDPTKTYPRVCPTEVVGDASTDIFLSDQQPAKDLGESLESGDPGPPKNGCSCSMRGSFTLLGFWPIALLLLMLAIRPRRSCG